MNEISDTGAGCAIGAAITIVACCILGAFFDAVPRASQEQKAIDAGVGEYYIDANANKAFRFKKPQAEVSK